MSNVLSHVATLTNLTSRDRWLFGRYRGHPVGVYQQGKMEGNQMVFQVLLASPAVQGVATAVQDKERAKLAGLRPGQIRLDTNGRILAYVHTPVVRSPKAEDVKGILDGLTGLADVGGPALGERCEQCGAPAYRVVLVNGTPTQRCDDDFRKLEARFGVVRAAVKQIRTDYAKGLGFGIVGFLIGSFLWAGILLATGYIVSIAAIAISLIVGFLVMKGAGKPTYGLVGVMVVLTLAAVFFGELLWIASLIVQLGGPFDLGLAFEGYLIVAGEDPGAIALSFFFGLIGVAIGGRYMVRSTRTATPRFEVIA